jgi:hypothetical protein
MALSVLAVDSAALTAPGTGITLSLPAFIPANTKALLEVNWQTTAETISDITTGWT